MSQMLSSVLECFARCLARSGVLAGDTWPALFVDQLLWRPQLAWPALHAALWGWLRIAAQGEAGAHERPLALLMLHLGSLQRASVAMAGRAPPRCVPCDSHLSALIGGRGVRGGACYIDTLLAHLPLASARSREWSMRLGACCLEAAVQSFDAVDLGEAPPESWRDAVKQAATSSSAVGPLSGGRVALLPASLLQLIHWLAQRDTPSMDDAERRAITELRRCMQLPGAKQLLQKPIALPSGDATRAWDMLARVH